MNRCAICAESAPASTFGLTPHGPICTTCGVRHFSTLVGPNGLALPPQASVEEVTRLAAMLSKIADLRARRLDHAWDEIVKAFDGERFKQTLCEWLDDPTLHTPYGTSQLAEVHDTEGITLLHYAAAYGGPAAVQKLLEHGASRDARTHHGRTPLDDALDWGHDHLRSLLQEKVEPPYAAPPVVAATPHRGGAENESRNAPPPDVELRPCSRCRKKLPRKAYSRRQWDKMGAKRRCLACVDAE
jgi:hypothetical protein